MHVSPGGLGRIKPPDFEHVERYPLSAVGVPEANLPVVVGFPWMTNFDRPQQIDGTWWVGKGSLGTERGGHCFCLEPVDEIDEASWYRYYDQGQTGHCVGFGNARAQSLIHRIEFDATWMYDAARAKEGNHSSEEGSTVRAAMAVLKAKGIKPAHSSKPMGDFKIGAYRWATSWDEVRATLGIPDDEDGVPFLNSWGEAYPEVTRLTDEAGAYCLEHDGEAGVFTES